METEDFLKLDQKQVMEWVSNDDVIVNAEEDIFKGIVKWVSHKMSGREENLPELLHQVRLPFVSHDFLLTELVKEELLTKNSAFCSQFMIHVIKSLLSSNDAEASHQPRKFQVTHIEGIFLCGGRKTLCYFPWKNMWHSMADTMFEHSTFTPAQYKHKIYILDVGSHKMDEEMARVMEYLEDNNNWAAAQGTAA